MLPAFKKEKKHQQSLGHGEDYMKPMGSRWIKKEKNDRVTEWMLFVEKQFVKEKHKKFCEGNVTGFGGLWKLE